jgi:hypothetical protein
LAQEAKEQLARQPVQAGLAQGAKEQLAQQPVRAGLAQEAKEQLARLQVQEAKEQLAQGARGRPEEPAKGLQPELGKDLQAKQLGAQEALQEQGLQAAG